MHDRATHLDEEQIARLLAGELPESAVAAARIHLAACADCSLRMTDATREGEEIDRLLATLDHPLPKVTPQFVMAHARRRGRRWQRLAASLAIGLGLVGGAYAFPGSPLPGWVAAVIERVTGPSAPGDPDSAPLAPADPSSSPPSPPAPEPMSGIVVKPGPSLLILFRAPAGEGEIQVSLTDGSEVRVRAPAGAGTFTAGADRILIEHPISAPYEVQIPRTAPRVEIQVDGRQIFLKTGARVTAVTPADGDEYILPLIYQAP
jgi:hypothetical protein